MPDNHKYISEEAFKEYTKGKKAEIGDLLIGRVGSKGETAVIDRNIEFAFYVSLGFVKTFKDFTDSNYLAIVLNSPYGNKYATGNMSSIGASAGNFNLGRIRSFPIPFPPLAEQKAIVEKVEKLMQQADAIAEGANVDDFEIVDKKAYQLLKNYSIIKNILDEITKQKEYVKQLKQSILQEAIQGNLTEDWRALRQAQEPPLEPASELLKRIKAEKEKLIKEKKIRKEKPLPPITEEEIPFELPKSWVWCYINELADLYTGNSINKSEKEAKYTKQQEGLIYIGTKDVEFNMKGINYNTGIIIPTKELDRFKIAPKNTVLICIEGGSSGKKIGITTQDVCFGNKLLVANTFINELSKFLYYLYNAPHFKSEFDKQRKGLRGGVSVNSFKNIKIPLPPLAEQKAIVDKVDNLMQKVSAMEEEIQKSEQNAQMLMQAVLKEAFEGKK